MTGVSKSWYEFVQVMNRKASEIHIWATSKGFYDRPRSFAEAIALMHSELSEALEADRTDSFDDKLPHRKGIEVELADACIRIMDTAAYLNLDLGMAIAEKMAFNEGRPYKHGKEY